jgi:CheY-like chemotaxis protein
MKKKLNCILLVDDDPHSNFFHQRLLNKISCTEVVEIALDGEIALNFIISKKNRPDIIFLDINMPKMDGWEFLEKYEKLTAEEKAKIVVMLSSSLNPDDKNKAENYASVSGFVTKYLEKQSVEEILLKHFPNHF